MQWKDDRVSALLLGRRAVRVIPFPGSVSEEGAEPLLVGVRLLTGTLIDQCRIDAAQYIKNKAKAAEMEIHELLQIESVGRERSMSTDELYRAMVFRAYIHPDDVEKKDPRSIFGSLQEVRGIDADIFEQLWEAYLDHQQYVSPRKSLEDVDVMELADALGKGPLREKAILALCEPGSRLRLLLTLAAQRATSPTGS